MHNNSGEQLKAAGKMIDENTQPDGQLAFSPAPGLTLQLKPVPMRDFCTPSQPCIYEVRDYKEVSLDPGLNDFIDRAMLKSKQ